MEGSDKHATDALRAKLLAWFDERSRDLPWRQTRDPYKIWVSEIMLQQTRVETVRPYYKAWMAAFPTLEDLAHAELDEVLHLWQGLGYYRRARTLHRAARELVEEREGAIPTAYESWLEVPGVGTYTAGAISSIAFDEVVPAVDGNVLRVLSRLFDDESDIASASTRRRFEELAATLVDPLRPGDFNQAVMELGATVCMPRRADCLLCPVNDLCAVRGTGRELELPIKSKKQKQRPEERSAVLYRRGDEVLVVQRKEDGLLGGLWEFPLYRDVPEALRTQSPRASMTHIFSHIRLEVEIYEATLGAEPAPVAIDDDLYVARLWLRADELESVPLSTLMRKMMAAQER